MSAIDEGIVREYFEQNGFLVRQARKYQVSARRKVADLQWPPDRRQARRRRYRNGGSSGP